MLQGEAYRRKGPVLNHKFPAMLCSGCMQHACHCIAAALCAPPAQAAFCSIVCGKLRLSTGACAQHYLERLKV